MGNVINVQMDEDFYNKVIANSGGSGSGDVESNVEYYRIDWDKANELGYGNGETGYTSPTFAINSAISFSQDCKVIIGSSIGISPTATYVFMEVISLITAIKFYKSKFYTSDNGWVEPKSFKDMIVDRLYDIFIPITKEEFYTV